MGESLDVQMARIQEQLKYIVSGMDSAKKTREISDSGLNRLSDAVMRLEHRMAAVEKQLSDTAPTIEEFVTIKHQVRGAGHLGKWAWALGGGTIALLYSARETLRSFF